MSQSVRLFAAIFATLCLMVAPEAPAQTDAAIDVAAPTTLPRAAESGRFFIQNFSPRDYGQHNANWAVAQDSSGLIYAANTNGVMIFDGASWQLVRTETRSTVRSLAVDARNRVYVGAHGDLGYLASDSLGEAGSFRCWIVWRPKSETLRTCGRRLRCPTASISWRRSA